jgi:hypothetical protein
MIAFLANALPDLPAEAIVHANASDFRKSADISLRLRPDV